MFIVNLLILIPELIGKFLFSIFGLHYPNFAIWSLLLFGSLTFIFFFASRESLRDYIVKRKVYRLFDKYIGKD